MTRGDDNGYDMTHDSEHDDRDIDAVLRGRAVAHRRDLDPLVALIEDARLLAAVPAKPGPALAIVLAAGLPAAAASQQPVARRQSAPAVRWAAAVRWASALRTAAAVRWSAFHRRRASVTAGILTSLALLSVTSAAAAGVLPDPIQNGVSTVVETVTPWRVPRPDRVGPEKRGPGKDHKDKVGLDKLKRDKDKQLREKQKKDKVTDAPGGADSTVVDEVRKPKTIKPDKPGRPVTPGKSADAPGQTDSGTGPGTVRDPKVRDPKVRNPKATTPSVPALQAPPTTAPTRRAPTSRTAVPAPNVPAATRPARTVPGATERKASKR